MVEEMKLDLREFRIADYLFEEVKIIERGETNDLQATVDLVQQPMRVLLLMPDIRLLCLESNCFLQSPNKVVGVWARFYLPSYFRIVCVPRNKLVHRAVGL